MEIWISMVKAVIAVRENKMGFKTAIEAVSVPRTTLKDYVISGL